MWSFGALLFEIWSLGHKPFEEYTNLEVDMKASRSEWANQRQEDSVSYKNFCQGNYIHNDRCFSYLGTIPLNVSYSQCQVPRYVEGACCKMSAAVEINFMYLTYNKMSATINKCQLSCLEMLGTYPIA